MIVAALFAAMQTVTMAAPPLEKGQTATGFECSMLDPAGKRFTLRGVFPAVPAGWDPNRGMPAQLSGTAPAELIGTVEMKPFGSTNDYRRFYVTKQRPEGGHYNMMFVLLDGDTSIATIDRYTPGAGGTPGTMQAFATGDCDADFTGKSGKAGAQ